MNKMRIGYFADGPWGHNAFEKIIGDESLAISFVCVRYDNQDEVLKAMADREGIPVLCTPNINSKSFLTLLKEYSAELFVSMSFNQIFRKDILKVPSMGIINCHAGKLPFYRGRNILNWALINDEKEFGITTHYVDEGIDTGDIILQKTFPITDEDTYKTLLEKAYIECPNILYQAIKQIQCGKVYVTKQEDIRKDGLYCGIRKAGDEIVDWNQTSREIFNFIRALTNPGPCACSYVNGEKIRFIAAEMIPDAPVYKGIPGQVLVKYSDSFLVKTKDSYIKITEYEGRVRVGDRLVCSDKCGGVMESS